MHQLEGFQDTTTLDLWISPESQNLTTIVTEVGEFIYNRFRMGIRASGDILQSKVDDILSGIEGVKTYIADMLVLGKGIFSKKYRLANSYLL